MAYNVIPKTNTEMRKASKSLNDDAAKDAILVYSVLQQRFPEFKDPLAIDPKVKSKVKLFRGLKGAIEIAELKKSYKIKVLDISWGDGSRGNRGASNAGGLFEKELEKSLLEWLETGEPSGKFKDFALDLVNQYELEDCVAVEVIAEGGENKKRPMKIVNGHWHIGGASPSAGYDIGATVTDITLKTECTDGSKHTIYLSCKTSGTTTLSNLGTKTNVFPLDQIRSRNIEKESGIALLKTFGLVEDDFCSIFIEAESGKVVSGYVDTSPNYNASLLKELILGSIGYGYHYCHLTKGHVKNFKMTKEFATRCAQVNSVTNYYGGKGGNAQRIDMVVDTPTMEFKFTIRDTSGSGGGMPDKLQSGYKFKTESEYTEFEDS